RPSITLRKYDTSGYRKATGINSKVRDHTILLLGTTPVLGRCAIEKLHKNALAKIIAEYKYQLTPEEITESSSIFTILHQ
ncbi:hypothetical protein NPIL_9491, partial [Nephila pilipes]